MPSGSGKKGGVPKRKKRASVPVETRSVRPCFNTDASSSLSEPQPSTSNATILQKNTSNIAGTSLAPQMEVSSNQAADPTNDPWGSLYQPSISSSGFGIVVGGSVNITNPTHSFANSPVITSVNPSQFPSPVLNMPCNGLASEHTNPFVLKFN